MKLKYKIPPQGFGHVAQVRDPGYSPCVNEGMRLGSRELPEPADGTGGVNPQLEASSFSHEASHTGISSTK
ncbi:MAG: hypothetical protein C0200_07615 [Thermoproteota archaeon]|nr:MAG: hypothetical protein C0200_07615 [Candidatus Korarchaeota archaeon]